MGEEKPSEAHSVDKDGFSRPLFACRCTTHPPPSVPGIQSRTVTVKTGPKLLQPILQCVVQSCKNVPTVPTSRC